MSESSVSLSPSPVRAYDCLAAIGEDRSWTGTFEEARLHAPFDRMTQETTAKAAMGESFYVLLLVL